MFTTTCEQKLMGPAAKLRDLMIATVFLLFASLGAKEIWTQEHRWVDVVSGMFYAHDFLHPMLNGNEYYDKPLLSYWLIAAMVKLTGHLSTWSLRLPSALAGVVAVGSTYQIGRLLGGKSQGILAGWLLLTSFYFIFWARVSSADMLNLGGTLLAIAWYFSKSASTSFKDYSIFFLIVALTALCKGLVAPAIIFLCILPTLFLHHTWRIHLLNSRFYLSILPAALVYLLPFWASSHWSHADYHSNGLMIMFRENIVRYFQPFDHQDPFYMYFIYLPVYLLPWTFLFIFGSVAYARRWRNLSWQNQWLLWTIGALLFFFIGSGSRRAYYILPILPFALLLTADWILSVKNILFRRWIARSIVLLYALFALDYALLQPLYYSHGGPITFRKILNAEISQIKPQVPWQYSLLDAQTKVNFYLELPPTLVNYGIRGLREEQTLETLRKTWPTLNNVPSNTIFITRRLYEPILNKVLKNYKLVEAGPTFMEWFLKRRDPDAPVAYVPLNNAT